MTTQFRRARTGLYVPHGGGSPPPSGYPGLVLAESSLQAYWRRGEANGATTLVDSSGLGHAGSYFAPNVSVPGLVTGDADAASTSTSFTTPGVTWMDATAFLTAGITVECILESNGSQSNRGIVTRFDANHCFLVWMNVSGFLGWRAYNTAGASVDLTYGTALTTGAKYHVAGTYTSGQLRLYINGTQVDASTGLTGDLKHGATQSIEIGCYQNNTFLFDGPIDEVAIYAGEQSAASIAARAALV